MTEQQTFYAVLDEGNNWYAGPFENANKADAVALSGYTTGEILRVIQYTVIATFGGTDE